MGHYIQCNEQINMPKSLERQLTYRMHLMSKLSDIQSKNLYLDECGLSLSEARSLTAIGAFAPLSINDLAFRANLNKGQASRAAQVMVNRKFVIKSESPDDGRGIELTLSHEGRKTFEKIMLAVNRRNREIFSCLSPNEKEQFGEMLDRVIKHLRNNT